MNKKKEQVLPSTLSHLTNRQIMENGEKRAAKAMGITNDMDETEKHNRLVQMIECLGFYAELNDMDFYDAFEQGMTGWYRTSRDEDVEILWFVRHGSAPATLLRKRRRVAISFNGDADEVLALGLRDHLNDWASTPFMLSRPGFGLASRTPVRDALNKSQVCVIFFTPGADENDNLIEYTVKCALERKLPIYIVARAPRKDVARSLLEMKLIKKQADLKRLRIEVLELRSGPLDWLVEVIGNTSLQNPSGWDACRRRSIASAAA